MKKNALLIYSLFICSLFPSAAWSQTKMIPYQQLPTASGAPSGSGMFFGASMTTSSITITFEGPSDRWIALGFGTSMAAPTDVLIYSIGHALSTHPLGWQDYYNSSYNSSGVLVDGIQNWNIISTNTLSGGQRTVTASRALSTGDANDIAFNFTATALSLVWARGATADYTIAYHGSTNRADGISLVWQSAPTASFITATTTLCSGSSITYSNLTTGGLTSYTWSFPGGNPATSTSTNPIVTYSVPGTYSVSLATANAAGSNTLVQANYITITPTVSPSVSITQVGGTNPMCAGSPATFTATAINGGSSPSFQWKVNGINAGNTTPTFTTSMLADSDLVTCIMTSNAVCASPSSITSAGITMTVNSTAPATVSVSLTGGTNPMCSGALAAFTATPGNGGTLPLYQWQVNGANTGSNGTTFTTNTLSNGDLVTCILNSNAPCASSLVATSSAITVTVSSVLVPSVSVAITTGSNPLCAATPVTFTATPANGGTAPSYQWIVNGNNSGTNSPVFSINTLTANTTISCVMTSNSPCANPGFASSSPLTLTVILVPTPVISPSGSVALCAGNSVTLSSSASSGNLWSNNATTQSIVVTASGNYSVTQIVGSCTSPPSATVSVTVHSIPNATLDPAGPFCKDADPVALHGTPPGGSYSGIGITGSLFLPSQANVGSDNIVIYQYYEHFGGTLFCADTATIKITVLDCTPIGEHEEVSSCISVYPNPGAGKFIIYSGSEKIIGLRVRDLSGKQILRMEISAENNVTVDLQDYMAGFYFLELQLETQILRTRLYKNE